MSSLTQAILAMLSLIFQRQKVDNSVLFFISVLEMDVHLVLRITLQLKEVFVPHVVLQTMN